MEDSVFYGSFSILDNLWKTQDVHNSILWKIGITYLP